MSSDEKDPDASLSVGIPQVLTHLQSAIPAIAGKIGGAIKDPNFGPLIKIPTRNSTIQHLPPRGLAEWLEMD